MRLLGPVLGRLQAEQAQVQEQMQREMMASEAAGNVAPLVKATQGGGQ